MQDLNLKYGPGVAALLRVRGVNPDGLVDQILLTAKALAGDAPSAQGICEQVLRLIGKVAPGELRLDISSHLQTVLAMDVAPLLVDMPVDLQNEVLSFARGRKSELSAEACDAWCSQFERAEEEIVSGPHALVVDDDPACAKFATKILESAGWKVDRAESAPNALRRAANQRYDFILMDYTLPDGCGAEVARAIRAGFGPSAGAYILGASVANVRRECLEAGMDEYSQKPIDMNTLKNRSRTVAAAAAQWAASEGTPSGQGARIQLRSLEEYRSQLVRVLAILSSLNAV